MRVRGFEAINSSFTSISEDNILLPVRSTKHSAGYDFFVQEDTVIPSVFSMVINAIKNKGKVLPTLVRTHVKSYMQEDEVLMLYNRSSNPKKLGLILANSVGVIDSDYYENLSNDGEILFAFYNIFPFEVTLKAGDKIGQGIFNKFYKADGDTSSIDGASRTGGIGSTGN